MTIMKVVVINALSARLGGGKTYIVNMLKNLPAEGVHIHLFCGYDFEAQSRENLTVHHCMSYLDNPYIRLAWEYLFLSCYLLWCRADILFCPGGVVNTITLNSCKVVTMSRNMLPFDMAALKSLPSTFLRLKFKLMAQKILSSLKRADLAIFISNYAYEVISQHIQVRNSIVIPHAVADIFFEKNDEWYGLNSKYILYVSRFEPYKNHDVVLREYALLPESVREEYKLLLVGGDGILSASTFKKLARKLGIMSQVVFLGSVKYEDLPSIYSSCTVFVFASSCENCPNIVLEAMVSGVPIISTDFKPMPEFLHDAALYFSPLTPGDLAAKINVFLSSESLRSSYGAAASKAAVAYRWERVARHTWTKILNIC